MLKKYVIAFLLISFSVDAKNPESFTLTSEQGIQQSKGVNKPVLSFNSVYDWMNMMIDDSWNNFSKIKSFANKNFGGIKEYNNIIIKVSEIPFLSNGRDATLKINMNTSVNSTGDIRSYYIRFSMTLKESEEFDKYWRPGEFEFRNGNLKIEPWDLSGIGISDLPQIIRYSSLKSKVERTDNYIFYPPYLNIYITLISYNENHNESLLDYAFFSSRINNSVEIEKVNLNRGDQTFHQNVRELAYAVRAGEIRNSKLFVGDEIKKFYPKTVLGDASWDSFPEKRFISKIQLRGTSGSFITGEGSYYGLIGRGDKNYFSNEMKNWVNYLSYALGKNYIAVKRYDDSNLLTEVSFIPVFNDFETDPEIAVIELVIDKNIFYEDGKEELVLYISKPIFGFKRYDDYWVPLAEMYDPY